MIVKILSKSATFKGVKYNTSKVEKDKGELMKVQNFGALQAIPGLRPQDYINYMEAISSRNKNVKFPQLHAVISCKGKEKGEEELTELAENWLKGMGYGQNPYLLIYHKDTTNNHIHMVSTRVGPDGKKISDSFEKLRAYEVLHQVMNHDERNEVSQHIQKALSYQFSTRAQFMMILEARGYTLLPSELDYKVCKYGKELNSVSFTQIEDRILAYERNADRIYQLRAIIKKYRNQYPAEIYGKKADLPGQSRRNSTAYSSLLAEMLAEKFGVQILFHAKENKSPYGYSIIDHSQKMVFKGGDIMPLRNFIQVADVPTIQFPVPDNKNQDNGSAFKSDTGLTDHAAVEYYSQGLFELNLNIAGDVDDEAVHGRKRNRKLKGRSR